MRDLGLRDARDQDIFFAARTAGVIVLSEDVDFVDLLLRHRPPPQVVWITCGNTSNARLREILSNAWVKAAKLLEEGEPLVEIQERVECGMTRELPWTILGARSNPFACHRSRTDERELDSLRPQRARASSSRKNE